MDVSYINPFVQGSQKVFANLCKETPALGRVFVKSQPYKTSPITVSIGLIGDLKGEVVYNMEDEVGCYLAYLMMAGLETTTLKTSPMAQSAVCELANIISGHVATLFSGKGYIIDIKPPVFRFTPTHADFPAAEQMQKIVCVPLTFQNGYVFEIDVLIPQPV